MWIQNQCNFDVIVQVDGIQYSVKKNSTSAVSMSTKSITLAFIPCKKNRIRFSLLNAWIGTLSADELKNQVICKCSVHIDGGHYNKIFLFPNKSRHNATSFISVVPENPYVDSVNYEILDRKKVRRKHFWIQILFISALPLLLAALIYSIIDPTIIDFTLFLCGILLFVFGTIPAVKTIIRFNKDCQDAFANHLLKSDMDSRSNLDQAEYEVDKLLQEKEVKGYGRFLLKILKHFIKDM